MYVVVDWSVHIFLLSDYNDYFNLNPKYPDPLKKKILADAISALEYV